MSHSHSGSDLGPELTYFNPSLGALHIPHKGQHSLLLGQDGVRVGVGVSLWNCGFSLFRGVVFQRSCKVKDFINITLLRLLGNPKSQLLWVMGHALSIQ